MTKLVLIKNVNFSFFKNNKSLFYFKYFLVPINLVIPSTSFYNKQIVNNDGLPLEFILNNITSDSIITNPQIEVIDWTTNDLDISQIPLSINQIFYEYSETHKIVILSLASDSPGEFNTSSQQTGALFVDNDLLKNYMMNLNKRHRQVCELLNDQISLKQINPQGFYTINDVAITINDFYNITVDNARGKVIKLNSLYE